MGRQPRDDRADLSPFGARTDRLYGRVARGAEDYEFWLRLAAGREWARVDDVTSMYYVRSDGSNRSNTAGERYFAAHQAIYAKHPSARPLVQAGRAAMLEVFGRAVTPLSAEPDLAVLPVDIVPQRGQVRILPLRSVFVRNAQRHALRQSGLQRKNVRAQAELVLDFGAR